MLRTFEDDGRSVREVPGVPAVEVAGAYTTLRTYGGRRILRLEQHVRRLQDSEETLTGGTLDAHLPVARVRRLLATALDATGHPESRVRLTWAPPRLLAAVEPFQALPEALYAAGVACTTVPVRRDNPQAKDTRFIATAKAAYAALPPGVNEGLMVAEDGSVLEGLSSNFFAVQDGVLHTEDARVLHGLSRALVLELAQGLVPVALRAVGVEELPRVSEAFLTSTSREVLPVARVDGQSIGEGRPGPVARELLRRLRERVEAEAERV